MSLRTTHLKFATAAAGAAALAIGTIASPALAASHTVVYNCPLFAAANAFPGSNGHEEEVSSDFDPGTRPASIAVGQTVTNTATMVVNLDPFQTGAAHTFGTSVDGDLVADGANGTLPFDLTFPTTTIPGNGTDSMTITASGPISFTGSRAGTMAISLGDMVANLTVHNPPAPDGPAVPVQCTGPTDGSQNVGTIAVVKDKTTTKASASYNAKKDKATGKATVKSHFGSQVTGKVTFTLKKGKKKIGKSVTEALNKKGIATHVFSKVKKSGKYTITAKYAGNGNLKGSSGSASFRVK
jgi:hypothetical protein